MSLGVSLTSRVPCAQEIDTAGEESSLEETEHSSESSKLRVLFDETHADHDGSPGHGDEGEMDARADFTDEDRGGRLEEDVRDEEDEVANVLALC